jgi:hypothetical protein
MKHLWLVFLLFSATAFAARIEFTATEFGQVDHIKLGMKFEEVEKIYGARAQWKQGANEPYLVVNLSKTCHVRVGSKEFGMVVSIAIPQACIQTFDGIKHGDLYSQIFKDKEPTWQDTPGEFPKLYASLSYPNYELVFSFPIDKHYWELADKGQYDEATRNLEVHYMSIDMPSSFFDAWYKEHPVEPTETDEVH